MKKTAALLGSSALGVALISCALGLRSAQAQSAGGEKIIGGPYVVNATPNSATVMWIVQAGQVLYGSAASKQEYLMPVLRAEKVHLTGLKPGTVQHYEAFPGEVGKGSFKTPPIGASPFEFVVYGDTRTRHDVHRAVINAILKYSNPDFAVQTGDLVEDGGNNALWPFFFDAERELLRRVPYYPALGNHERNAKNYYDYMEARPYYSFEWGNAHFIVLNSDIESAGADKAARDAYWREETRWLEDDLKNSQGAGFRFLIAHHPPITAVRRRQGDNPHMTALEPMLEKYRVSAAFFGHDHNYEHFLKNGLHYFVTGGGGAPLYDVDTPPPGITVKVASTENFVVVKVNGTKAHVDVFKPNGEKLESVELGR